MELIFLFIFVLSVFLIHLHIKISERRLVNLEMGCIHDNIKMIRGMLEMKNAKDCVLLLESIETNVEILVKDVNKDRSILACICDVLTAYKDRFYNMIQYENYTNKDYFTEIAYGMLKELEREIFRILKK